MLALLILFACGPYDQVYVSPTVETSPAIPDSCVVSHVFAGYSASHTTYACDGFCMYDYRPRVGVGLTKEIPCAGANEWYM